MVLEFFYIFLLKISGLNDRFLLYDYKLNDENIFVRNCSNVFFLMCIIKLVYLWNKGEEIE